MYRTDGSLVLSPTDLTRHQACPHATTLDLAVADGRPRPPPAGRTDPPAPRRAAAAPVPTPPALTRPHACPHATTLDLAVADGRLRPPLEGPTDHAALVADLGPEPEPRYPAALSAAGRRPGASA